jgi:hypothetical protein
MASSTTVEIGVFLTTADAPYFRLNDPVKGVLNNPDYRLAGPIFYDITDRVTSVNVNRGKNRQLERYNAGRATVSLNNQDRLFDPLNTDSVLFGNIIPRRQIRVRSGGYDQFFGVVEDWNFDYDVSGISTAQITAADGFSLLAQQTLTAGTATAQTTGERVEAILSMPSVAWPLGNRVIDEGLNSLGADVWESTDNALTYLQQVETSEQGQLFITRDGNIRFINGGVTPTSSDVTPLFSDAGNGVPYVGAEVSYGTELLFNNVQVEYPAGTAIANNLESQEAYGITTTDISTLLATGSDASNLAQFWVSKYGEPEYRFDALTVSLDGLQGLQKEEVLQFELGDIIQVEFTPNRVGDPIERYGQIIGIQHTVGVDRHTITYSLGSLQFAFLVLDDEGFGILDVNALAF